MSEYQLEQEILKKMKEENEKSNKNEIHLKIKDSSDLYLKEKNSINPNSKGPFSPPVWEERCSLLRRHSSSSE